MGVLTIEGVVEHGRIKLKDDVHLPENTRVYVLVPEVQDQRSGHVPSPRLARAEQARDFQLEVVEDSSDAGL